MDITRQIITNIGGYNFCKHALVRIQKRNIRKSDIFTTLDSIESIDYPTYNNRTIIHNHLTGLSVIVDNKTNIIITVTETETRKQYVTNKNKYRQFTINTVYYPVVIPPIRCC